MNITWYGHRCVRIETKEGSILLDPFGKDVGLRGPKVNDDLVLVSPSVAPAGVLEQVPEGSFVIQGPGEYESKGIAVRGIQAYQDSQKGAELGLATIYTITAEDMTVCHLGALGQDKLSDEQREAIGDPDILIIPAGGQSALDAKAAAELVTQIEPKVIVPVQFALPDASYEAEKVDKFIKEVGLPVQKTDTLRIARKQLPADQTMLYVLRA